MQKFRISKSPKRTFEARYSNYRRYKEHLKRDFNDRCGYCDVFDGWFGGNDSYHIDHFAPKSKFKELESEYSNLVYSCPYCNRAKGNDWVTDTPDISHNGEIGYIDPCDTDYEKLFCRTDTGEIEPLTSIGEYMYNSLNFYLSRHKVIWNLSRLHMLLNEIDGLLDDPEIKPEYKTELEEFYTKLSRYFQKYLRQHFGKYE